MMSAKPKEELGTPLPPPHASLAASAPVSHCQDVLHALSEEVFRTEAEKKGEVLDYLQGSKRHGVKKARGKREGGGDGRLE